MADKLSSTERSRLMSRIPAKHTKPERMLRSLLHRLGYRFTINGPKNRALPGKPDIVLPARRAVIFAHGCFWHRCPGCPLATMPKTNRSYWQAKFERNMARDQRVSQQLENMRWRVIVIWECELRELDKVAARILSELPRAPYSEMPEDLDDQLLVAETRAPYQTG